LSRYRLICAIKSLLGFFINIGTEKKNDNAKKVFYRSSNKWNAARDILVNEYRLNVMRYFERKKLQYRHEKKWKLYGISVYILHRKHDKGYWEEEGIEETRQK